MKTKLFVLFVALFLAGCGESSGPSKDVDMTNTAPKKDAIETAVDWSKLQDRSGVTYLPNTDKPYSGWAKQNYDNEQVKVLAEFTDGSVTRLKQWKQNGIPKWDIGYSKGKVSLSDVPLGDYWDSDLSLQHGLDIKWFTNGQKEFEDNYKDGIRDGLSTSWYESGQKAYEDKYIDDKLMFSQNWKPNGEKCPESNLKDGNGLCVSYYQNGQKNSEENWKDGVLNGPTTYWYENGQKNSEENYKDGKEHGVHIFYNEDGTEDYRITFKDGEEVED